jgi:hypothetical protein
MHRYRRDDSDRLLVCLVWSLNEFFSSAGRSEPLDIRIEGVFFYLYLPNPSSHVLPPSSHPLLCLAQEKKGRTRERRERRLGHTVACRRHRSSSRIGWISFPLSIVPT